MSENPFDPQSLDELPRRVPVFPLTGATLLPGTQLPLNIFEPRYLNMVLDTMSGDRLIGMLQPDPTRPDEEPVATYPVGCAGRIVAFNETPDGRLLISLQGVCRFRVAAELPVQRGYRRVQADWQPFAVDLTPELAFSLDREAMRASLRGYLRARGIRVDWEALTKMHDYQVVDFLSMNLPFEPEEKQALLTAMSTGERAAALMTVAEMAASTDLDAGETRH
jgi:Lon protease-like protein